MLSETKSRKAGLKENFLITLTFIFIFSIAVMPHGDEEHKEKVQKVSSEMQMEDQHSQMKMEGEHVHSDSLEEAEENKAQERDFAQIREDVENSTVPTVIKAVSLAAFIIGLAFLYLPRKKKGNLNV